MYNPLISLFAIILSVAFAFLYVKPEYALVQKHRDELAQLNDIFKDTGSIDESINETQKTLEGVDTVDRGRFSVLLPEEADPLRFAHNLQYLGLKNGLVLVGIKVEVPTIERPKDIAASAASAVHGAVQGAVNVFTIGKKAELKQAEYEASLVAADAGAVEGTSEKKYVTTKASFGVTTTADSFAMLLSDLEKSLRLIDVVSLSFSPADKNTDTKSISTTALPIYKYVVAIESYSLK
ncbi:MAG: hypothetical protein HZB10_00465 [Candidatus Yonathbacteria bacterium]|nr:hypothetical protein [Candidatus Yonathbacteria bacterium]